MSDVQTDTKRTSPTPARCGLLRAQRKHIVRFVAVMVVTLGLSGCLSMLSRLIFGQTVLLFCGHGMGLGCSCLIACKAKTQTHKTPSLDLKNCNPQENGGYRRLAGGVAHDFNNLARSDYGYSDLLLESIGSSDPNRAKLEQIKQAATSAASLTRQL